jgi:hypothetical protein
MAERKSVYVTPKRHQALKAGALAAGKTIEQYTEELLQIAYPLKKDKQVIIA